MDNSDTLRNQIYNSMQLKTTEELMFIWEQNDHEEWSDTAFAIVRQILIQRTGTVPETPVSQKPTEIPPEWKTLNWQKISEKFDIMFGKTNPIAFTLVALVVILFLLGLSTSYSPSNTDNSTFFAGLFLLVPVGVVLLVVIWSYLRKRNADRVVAQARVLIKQETSHNRGATYDVSFAIKSAFSVANKELVANEKWIGHHTLSVPRTLYKSINEQEILNLVFLSTGQVLGLVEEFEKG